MSKYILKGEGGTACSMQKGVSLSSLGVHTVQDRWDTSPRIMFHSLLLCKPSLCDPHVSVLAGACPQTQVPPPAPAVFQAGMSHSLPQLSLPSGGLLSQGCRDRLCSWCSWEHPQAPIQYLAAQHCSLTADMLPTDTDGRGCPYPHCSPGLSGTWAS